MTKPPNPASYKHPDAKRKMIPTAEQQGFVAEDEARPKKLRYPRNADLDPQFVWKGKDQEDLTDLLVDAPPIYKQEHIHPRAIIARLKAEAARADAGDEPDDQMSMFAEFNGRPKDIEAHTEVYEHDQDWQNRMILGDSLMVMASLAERENLRGQVQAIYFDPPYGIKFNSNWQASTASRDVTDGRTADTSREPEVIRAFRDTWRDGIHSYMSYLRDRLVLARDLLAEFGSIFVQIGDENVHRVRALLDEVFGEANFINTIVFKKKSATLSTETVYDLIVWYARSASSMKLRELFENRNNPEGESKFNSIMLPSGAIENVSSISKSQLERVLAEGGSWARVNYPIVSQHPSDTRSVKFRFRGIDKSCGNNKQWRFDPETQMPRLERAGRLFDGGGKSLGGVMLLERLELGGPC